MAHGSTLPSIHHRPPLLVFVREHLNAAGRALNVLEAWGFERWPDDHRHHLSVMAVSDPVAKVRERAIELLSQGD
jgi:hypothetical protein